MRLKSNTRYRVQLPAYEIERCEMRYEAAARAGWRLDRIGIWLERYRKSEPEERQYRLEFCPVRMIDGVQELSDDQIGFYEDCGWRLECSSGGRYVFSASADSEPTEIYTDAKEQIRMLKSVKNYVKGSSGILAGIFLGDFLAGILFAGSGGVRRTWSLEAFYAVGWFHLAVLAMFLKMLWKDLYSWFRCRRLIRRAKKGLPLREADGNPPRRRASRAASAFLDGLIAVCVAGCAFMLLRTEKTDLPAAESDVPYLMAEDFFRGERKDRNRFSQEVENTVTAVPSAFADYYEVEEYLEEGNRYLDLSQDVYRLRGSGKNALALARSLIQGSLFGRKAEFTVIEREDFDYAASGPYTLIAVRGRYVIRVTCLGDDTGKLWEKMLDELSERWP